MGSQQLIIKRFQDRYRQPVSSAELAVEREAIGANVGANGYTTVDQADLLAGRLGLRPGMRLLDLGAGRGWPGLYLARKTGCHVVLADVPEPALRAALDRARRQRLQRRASIVMASAIRPPFRAASFDAAVHTDTL